MALKPRPLSFQPTKTHTNGQRANSSLMLSGPLPPPLALMCVLAPVLVLSTHTVYTCCNHFMDIFERQIVKRQICLFAVLRGAASLRSQISLLIAAFPVRIRKKKTWGKIKHFIVWAATACTISMDPGIELIIAGTNCVCRGANKPIGTSSCPDV